jgi:3-deoxy-manno-octulosonate cytidylyltransferase (CMP-KDO synthetase)
MKRNILGIIPARFGSSRFEGKPLVDIHGKPMIQWVYEASCKALDSVVVATDDRRIESVVKSFGGRVVMTSKDHINGTSRCVEALEKFELEEETIFSAVINIQGDEPMIEPEVLRALKKSLDSESVDLATLVSEVTDSQDLFNEGEAFVTLDNKANALYFSRSVIPFVRNVPKEEWINHHLFYKHLGMYAYSREGLYQFSKLLPSSLELAESLEQNRWLEAGFKIQCAIVKSESIPVDTPQDLERVLAVWKKVY